MLVCWSVSGTLSVQNRSMISARFYHRFNCVFKFIFRAQGAPVSTAERLFNVTLLTTLSSTGARYLLYVFWCDTFSSKLNMWRQDELEF